MSVGALACCEAEVRVGLGLGRASVYGESWRSAAALRGGSGEPDGGEVEPPGPVALRPGTDPNPNPNPNPTPNTNPNLTLPLSKASGGFFWEVYKPTADGEATATATAQAICNAVLPGNARCVGKFLRLPPLVTPRPTPNPGRTDRLVESVDRRVPLGCLT